MVVRGSPRKLTEAKIGQNITGNFNFRKILAQELGLPPPPSHILCCLNWTIYAETGTRGIPRNLTEAKIGQNSTENFNLG